MAHFAELDAGNKVLRVVVVSNDDCKGADGSESEATGVAFCQKLWGKDTHWKQTSYNTRGGVHRGGGIPFRKNYAGPGYIYDEDRDAFYPPPPHGNWILDEETCFWNAPIPRPAEGLHIWSDEAGNWLRVG